MILEFLTALEVAFPPPVGCHHAITRATEDGSNKLRLLILTGSGRVRAIELEDGDLTRPVKELVISVDGLLREQEAAA